MKRILSFVAVILVCLGNVFLSGAENENTATPVDRIKAPPGFKVELLYSVPADQHGSWVAMCTDPKGRLIVSDQYGGLYRVTPPAPGASVSPSDVEKIPVTIRAANGLLWAFDSLYVGINDYERKMESGLYRVTDSNGDDQLDKVEKLRGMKASGDHGIHAVLLAPDKKSLFLITGNNTEPTAVDASRVPLAWGEDHLLPRMPDGRGHNRNRLAPGGIIYKVSPDGKTWENYSSGYRNIYDGGFNLDGELFAYDADMEYDFNTPWYRPTRVCHVTSGSMWGWRNGTGKRPEWYPDTLPAMVNIGPGSPTGATFGYGAKFPSKYQEAFYLLDWSWGKIYAVHLKAEGASYVGEKETFITGSPLPVADAIIHPGDGSMYFCIGGRRVQSGLYRVRYVGNESTAPLNRQPATNSLARLRHQLESYHRPNHPQAIADAWPFLDHEDVFIRWAARTAIQLQPLDQWSEKALQEPDHGKRATAILGLAKMTGIDPFHRKPTDPPVDKVMQKKMIQSLLEADWDGLNEAERRTLVRAYQICMTRFGQPEEAQGEKIIAQLDPHFPAITFELNWLLCETLAYLQSPTVATKALALMKKAPTQEEQMEYARSLRLVKSGWNTILREAYFEWFLKASNYRGGASFAKFIEFIRNDAVASLSFKERQDLKEVLERQPDKKTPLEALAEAMAGRSYVKEWKLEELSSAAQTKLKGRDFQRGRRIFAAAGCFACHRFDNQGGMMGPDLSTAGGRYSAHDLLDSIINPNKEINEQFVPVVVTRDDGEMFTGVVVNLNRDGLTLNTDMFNPNQQVTLDRKKVKSIETAKVSPMPEGLLNMFQEDELMDLVAYILSGGNEENAMFSR